MLERISSDHPSADCLADAFIASKQIRYGSRPCADNFQHMQSILKSRTDTGEPIKVLVMYGAVKVYNHYPVRCCDFLDLVAIKRMMCLNDAVKRHYSPGIQVSVIFEDYTEAMTSGETSDNYRQHFCAILEALGLSYIQVIRESSLIPANFTNDVLANAQAIADGREHEVGWHGPILWDYYLGRASSEYPQADESFLRSKVAAYLGICLARYQHKTLPNTDIKLSFATYPKEVPNSFRRGRVEYKMKPSRTSESTIPPWCGYGVIRESDWTHVSSRQYLQGNYKIHMANVAGVEVPVMYAT